MDLWNKMIGVLSVRILTADPEGMLNRLIRDGVRVWDVEVPAPAELTLKISRADREVLTATVNKQGGKAEILRKTGALYWAAKWQKRPLFLLTAGILTLLTMVLPERILFLDVQGNVTVPDERILEEMSDFGLKFGCDARQVRSEVVKNGLLERIGQLKWVGVNLYGCRAVVSVRERQQEPAAGAETYGNLVACADGIIDSVVIYQGNLRCKTGQAVSQGDVLISGYSDLGICNRLTPARGEIYALTSREIRCILPNEVYRVTETGKRTLRIAVIFGKKADKFVFRQWNFTRHLW